MTHIFRKTIFSALLASSILMTTSSYAQSLDRIVAVLNDTVITQTELDAGIQSAKKQLTASNIALPSAEVIRKKVLDQMINRKLQLQLAEQAGFHLEDKAVDAAVDRIASQNKVTADEVYAQVNKQTGLSKEAYRDELREELTIQQVQQQEVASKIVITPQEVKDFMRSSAWQAFNTKEYHLEDILIALPDTPSPQDVAAARKRADALVSKLHAGASFKDAATTENSAMEGGDLGWRALPQIPSAFAGEIVHLKLNDIMGPVLAPNGFHIVKLTGIRSAGKQMDAAMQKKQVEQLLFQRKYEEEIQNWTTKLRAQAFINTNPEA